MVRMKSKTWKLVTLSQGHESIKLSNHYMVRRMVIEEEKYNTILNSEIKSTSFTYHAIYLPRRKIKQKSKKLNNVFYIYKMTNGINLNL